MTSKSGGLNQPAYNSSTWNTPLNNNFSFTDAVIGGVVSVNLSSGDVTLTTASPASTNTPGQSQYEVIQASNSSAFPRNLSMAGGLTGAWIVQNVSSTQILNVYATTSSGAFVVIQPNQSAAVFSPDGANMYQSISDVVKSTGSTMTGALNISASGDALNVNSGQLRVNSGTVYSTGSFYANSNVTAASDVRIKENIATIEDALDIVKKLRGVRYNRIDNGESCVGVIAQEIQEVLPEVVAEGDNGLLHVAYGNIISVLINAIQELSVRVEKLEG